MKNMVVLRKVNEYKQLLNAVWQQKHSGWVTFSDMMAN